MKTRRIPAYYSESRPRRGYVVYLVDAPALGRRATGRFSKRVHTSGVETDHTQKRRLSNERLRSGAPKV